MKPVQIYKLIDPRDLTIKYIGKTCNKLSDRLSSHIWEASKSGRKNKRLTWIKSLLNLSLKPIIESIEICENNHIANERERYYIKHFKEEGVDLKNTQPGGDGQPPGYQFKNRYVSPKGVIPEQFIGLPHVSTRSDWREIVAKQQVNKIKPKEKLKLRKSVIVYDIVEQICYPFDSVKAAASFIGMKSIDISERCRNIRESLLKNKYTCSWKKNGVKLSYTKPYHGVIRFKDNKKEEFVSILSASKICKLKRQSIYDCIKSGEVDKYGYHWKTN